MMDTRKIESSSNRRNFEGKNVTQIFVEVVIREQLSFKLEKLLEGNKLVAIKHSKDPQRQQH